jgi:hypothetical protein
VGLNPYRQQRRRPSDYALFAFGVVLCLAVVAWALFG